MIKTFKSRLFFITLVAIGEMSMAKAKTKRMFAVLLPMILPKARSVLPCRTAPMDTVSSDKLVPKPIMIALTKNFEILKFFDKCKAPLKVPSPPTKSKIKPPTNSK